MHNIIMINMSFHTPAQINFMQVDRYKHIENDAKSYKKKNNTRFIIMQLNTSNKNSLN